MAKFDLNDSGVVVIVGSGAGGGTLGNELAQKGVKVVILEAGSRVELQDFVNDEWESFTQLAWSDMRTTSGSWRVAKDFPNLPAWIVKAVGGSTTHWAGASLRFDEHEFKVKSAYGGITGANLLDWPITLAEMEPWYAKAEDKMGVTRTNGIPGLPGNNNFKVLEAGAKKLGYQEVHTGLDQCLGPPFGVFAHAGIQLESGRRMPRESTQRSLSIFHACRSSPAS